MKYNGYNITPSPTEKFPDMVQLSNDKITKKFVSEERAVLWIEEQKTEQLINTQKINVEAELIEQGLVFFDD